MRGAGGALANLNAVAMLVPLGVVALSLSTEQQQLNNISTR